MDWIELAKLAGAVAVPIVAVAGLFYAMMRHALAPLGEDLRELRRDVHSIDVRLARLEGRYAAEQPAATQ